MDLASYKLLPDYLEPPDIERYCVDVLANSKVEGVQDAIQKLDILGDHQWHSYEEPSIGLKRRLEEWLKGNWNECSEEFLAGCLGIAYDFALSTTLYEKALSQYKGEFVEEYKAYLAHSTGPFIDPFWSFHADQERA